MFYAYSVVFYDDIVCDSSTVVERGLLFAGSLSEAAKTVSDWYGETNLQRVDLQVVDNDNGIPIIPIVTEDLLDNLVTELEAGYTCAD